MGYKGNTGFQQQFRLSVTSFAALAFHFCPAVIQHKNIYLTATLKIY